MSTGRTSSLALALVLGAAAVAGCRGGLSKESPIHLIGDMDWQPKYESQEESRPIDDKGTRLFADGRANRPLEPGVVAQGFLKADDRVHLGKNTDGSWVKKVPLPVDDAVLTRGQNRFNVFCAPCHDKSGSGKGMVIANPKYPNRFPVPPPHLAEKDKLTDGEIFDAMLNGVRGNMPSYRKQMTVEDRWAVVAWVRVLQRSQAAKLGDVPSDKQSSIEAEGGMP
jgi:mono/diheme cytochrome c family protein